MKNYNKYGRKIVGTRISEEQENFLIHKAQQKRISKSTYIRDLILRDLYDKDEEMLSISILNLRQQNEDISNKLAFLIQLFHHFLVPYFSFQPETEDENKETLLKLALEKRKDFMEGFMKNFYIEDGDFFDELLANSLQNINNDEANDE